jgi:hypothetical protein
MFVLLLTIKLSTVVLGSFESRNQCVAAGMRIENAIQQNTYKYHPDVSYMCVEKKNNK